MVKNMAKRYCSDRRALLVPAMAIMLVPALLPGCAPVSDDTIRKVGYSESDQRGLAPSVTSLPSELDPATVNFIRSYGPTIKRYASMYGFDWRLVLAVMKQESRFNVAAESHRGASGLMQIMPRTSKEVARMLDIRDMGKPNNNIRGGVYYLGRLYRLFEAADESDRIRLTLAAYNAGISRVYDAQMVAAYFHEDPLEWSAVRDAIPLLSKRYYTLHKSVWEEERPTSGWFGNSRETLSYVENVMDYYDEYRLILN